MKRNREGADGGVVEENWEEKKEGKLQSGWKIKKKRKKMSVSGLVLTVHKTQPVDGNKRKMTLSKNRNSAETTKKQHKMTA